MIPTITDLAITGLCAVASLFLYQRSRFQSPRAAENSQAFILENTVTHARLLPVESKHAFTYPTVAFLLSLNALEDRKLEIGRGWLFGYGGGPRIFNIRTNPYLTLETNVSIRQKLIKILRSRGYEEHGDDIWMLTMPRVLGFEGINPLTVYFCLKDGRFCLTVLEIHNTFGETHVHVLEVGKNEDSDVASGFDHQWTFRREFHVSPFNDRSGYYSVSVCNPFDSSHTSNPRPTVRVHQHSEGPDESSVGPLKLTAILRPVVSTPMTASSLLGTLTRYPFTLFLSFSRILYHAWLLHYVKRLDVFVRPEPYPVSNGWGQTETKVSAAPKIPGGIKWLPVGSIEGFARRRTEMFLHTRALETGITIVLLGPEPSVLPTAFSASQGDRTLTISYLSGAFFTLLFACPSAEHALLLGCDTEKLFVPSSRTLFQEVFSVPSPTNTLSLPQRYRVRAIPPAIKLLVPPEHFLDGGSTSIPFAVVILLQMVDTIEEKVFSFAGARVVPGKEPWKRWERAAQVFEGKEPAVAAVNNGSVWRL